MKYLALSLVFSFSMTACKYSNTFEGTYNNSPASLSAYSKNTSRYCISLNLTSGATAKSSYISANDLYDSNDIFKPKAFNTKGAACGSGLTEYLVGLRNSKVLDVFTTDQEEKYPYNFDYCQIVYYKEYKYQDDVRVDFKNNSDDQLVGTFIGTGEVDYYVDYDHPINYGPIYYCGPYYPNDPNYPFPHYPPYPPYPPFPH